MKKLTIALALAIPAALEGQQADSRAAPPPSVAVEARGEVMVTPDRATIQIGVETRAQTAAAAAAENAQIQQRVLAAIRRLGIPEQQISTTGYTITPEYRYDTPTREPRLVGYRVNNTVVVDVRQLQQVGPIIDAAVAAGANVVSSLRFYSSNVEQARRDAIARAVETARRDAEVIARAAGGALGNLLEANVGAHMPPPMPPVPFRVAAAEMADTPITPGEQAVVVSVSTRWLFVPAP